MDLSNPMVSYEVSFREEVKKAFTELGIDKPPVIEKPRSGQADLCLVVFSIVKDLGMKPQEITERIKDLLQEDPKWDLTASGGYLNCNFRPEGFITDLGKFIWQRRNSLCDGPPRGIKVTVEHTSANPNGPFHVGRARNPIIGDTLVRLLRKAGYNVEAQYWVNDMGKQVMILVWGIKNISEDSLPPSERDKTDHLLVRYYQAANAKMEEDPKVQDEINALLKEYEEAVKDGEWGRIISRTGSSEIRASDVKEACNGVLEGMVGSLSRLGVGLDRFVYESQVVEDHSLWNIIGGLEKSPLSRDEDGAKYLDLSGHIKGGDEGQYKRRFVFTRSDGSALYTTRDLAYHSWKLSQCDQAINVLGEDHRYQSQMLELALSELGSEKLPETVFYAFVSLPEGKMSTRRNRVVFLDDLLDEAVERAKEEVLKRRDDLSSGDLDEISNMVGIGALRFNTVKVQPEKKIIFKWEEALNFEGSSAPFVQYSHARACSILRKWGSEVVDKPDWSKMVEGSEKDLVKTLARFPLVIEESALKRKIHLIPLYLIEVASSFNDFYRDCPVLNESDKERKMTRLALVTLTRNVLKDGLEVIGIRAPERM
jgi:arginyl-tRNA synthetase